MSFKNDCCYGYLFPLDVTQTGTEVACECGNVFISTGDAWRNVLELGARKADRFRQLRKVNLMLGPRTEPRDQPF